MPIPKAEVVSLSDAERQGLAKLIKRHQVGQQIALRARIVLAAAHGLKNKEIAQTYDVTLETVRLWRNRWVKLQDISLDDLSLEERLTDAPRPGAPAKITADQRCRIEALDVCSALAEGERKPVLGPDVVTTMEPLVSIAAPLLSVTVRFTL